MSTVTERALGSVLRTVKRVVKSSSLLRNLIADQHSTALFTNLRSHEVMLSDRTRVNTYREGLSRQIKPGSVVLDLGTGTGILSLLAARQNPKKIYAIDHSDFITVARKIAAENNVTCIEFVQANSRTFTPPDNGKVDTIIHEQMGTALFEENMINNLLDLKQRLLKPGGSILPGKFEVFLEPVSLKPDYLVPHISNIAIEGVDLKFLRNLPEAEKYKGSEYLFGPTDARVAVDRFLCRPEPFLQFDLNSINDASEIPTMFMVTRKLETSGSLDAFCLYFKAIFDEQTSFDTSPLSAYTHWGNKLFRADGRSCEAGTTVSYAVEANPLEDARKWSILVDAEPAVKGRSAAPKRQEMASARA